MIRGNSKSAASSSEEEKMDISMKEGKGKRLWKKVKYQLVEYHSLPGYLRDNEYIIGHYRSEWPLKQAFLSMFTIHNETLNVWTHLIGFALFLALTIYTAMKVPRIADSQTVQHLTHVLKTVDLHKIHSELLACLSSISNITDLQRFRDDLKASLPSVDLLPSLPSWHTVELLTNCLPERFFHVNQTDPCVLVWREIAEFLCAYMLSMKERSFASARTNCFYDIKLSAKIIRRD